MTVNQSIDLDATRISSKACKALSKSTDAAVTRPAADYDVADAAGNFLRKELPSKKDDAIPKGIRDQERGGCRGDLPAS